MAERKQKESALTAACFEPQEATDKLAGKVTKTAQNAVEVKRRKVAKLENDLESPAGSDDGYRIYPHYFAPILIQDGEQHLIVPARYQILPCTGVEVPPQQRIQRQARLATECAELETADRQKARHLSVCAVLRMG